MPLSLTGSATEIVCQVASGELSAVEVLRAHLDRVAALDRTLHAFVDVRADAAMADATRQDDQAARGVPRGPLGGLPVTVKSAIEIAGVRCEVGSRTRAGTIATRDAVVVERLRAAGAIVLGTTNVAEMLMAYDADNPLYGRTSNPWDRARTPGGSSGGEAAAIATGCSAAGIGSDGGGSIRVPAHFAGICGFKPTPGRIPASGHQPPCLGPFSLIGVVGPMARTVGDLALLDSVLAGRDAGDPMSFPSGQESSAAPAVRGTRVAWFTDSGDTPVTPETRAAVRAVASWLEDAGCMVDEYRPPVVAKAGALWDTFFAEVALLLLHDEMGGRERELPILRAYLDRRSDTTPLTAGSLTAAWVERDVARAELAAEMIERRVLICPVAAVPATRHGEREWSVDGRRVDYIEAMRYTQWFNVLGNPAVVVPVAQSAEGLPIGIQVVGRPYDDRFVLEVAAVIERASGGYRPPPGFEP